MAAHGINLFSCKRWNCTSAQRVPVTKVYLKKFAYWWSNLFEFINYSHCSLLVLLFDVDIFNTPHPWNILGWKGPKTWKPNQFNGSDCTGYPLQCRIEEPVKYHGFWRDGKIHHHEIDANFKCSPKKKKLF